MPPPELSPRLHKPTKKPCQRVNRRPRIQLKPPTRAISHLCCGAWLTRAACSVFWLGPVPKNSRSAEFKVSGRKKITEIVFVFEARDSHAPPLPRGSDGFKKEKVIKSMCSRSPASQNHRVMSKRAARPRAAEAWQLGAREPARIR